MIWESIPEESNDIDMEFQSFQISRSTGSDHHHNHVVSRRLNLDGSMRELTFYDDIPLSQERIFTTSPPLMGLLSPEGSPQHFQVIERTKILSPYNGNSGSNRPALASRNILSHKTNGTAKCTTNTTNANRLHMFHSLSSGSIESSIDDDYMEFFEVDDGAEITTSNAVCLPSDLNSLISGQIIRNSPMKSPQMRRPPVRRCLSLTENQIQCEPKISETVTTNSPTFNITNNISDHNGSYTTNMDSPTVFNNSPPRLLSNGCFKRPDPPSANSSPVLSKRCRTNDKENQHVVPFTECKKSISCFATSRPSTQIARPVLRKSMSMNDAEILTALARSENKDEPDLIGDFSKPFILPLIDGRHRDLKSVSCDTLANLLNGKFDNQVASYEIIDCRYPYEYEGGHIRGAKNLYCQEQIIEEFLSEKKTERQQAETATAGNKRNIIIFHCEFSSERGPKLSRFLRNNDRARNTTTYPNLDYPEIYLLHNGYKEFYEKYAALCEPHAYRPMLEPSYNREYRHFRAKSKSWNGDGIGGSTQRFKKTRPRLLL